MSNPSISIITATFNAEKHIVDCITSINKQTIQPSQHIFIDGLSSDNTVEIIKSHSRENTAIISEKDKGIYDAMNKGIDLATGDIIGILNADDFYAASNVLDMVAKAFDDREIMLCYGDLIYINEENKVVRKWKAGNYTNKSFYWGWMPPHPTVFIRKSVYKNFGKFRLDLGSAADYELMLRLLFKEQLPASYISSTLVHMRTGGVSNASTLNRYNANRMDRKAWQENQLRPKPWTLLAKPLRKIPQWLKK